MALRRLTAEEYSYTIEDLLGDTSGPGRRFAEDAVGPSGFAMAGLVASLEFRQHMEAAELAAAGAAERLGKLLPCDPAAGEDRCAVQFIETFGRRAYRRKLAAGEVTALEALYRMARSDLRHDFKNGIRVVLQAILQSPNFLYRWELDPRGAPAAEAGMVKLGGDEIASRLSYVLWRSMPDEALFRAADTGKLGSAAAVEAEARRMLADPKARRALASFHQQWLELAGLVELPKDTKAYPQFTVETRAALEEEPGLFVAETVQKGDGKLGTLLTAPFGFVNASSARLYGVASPPSGAALEKRSFDPSQRAGLLTMASLLAKHGGTSGSHPVKRGKLVYERFLCREVPPPPEEVPPPKPPAPSASTRERYAEHANNPGCVVCHTMLDPPGFAFEHYDGIGQYRTTDGGKAVDASGTLQFPEGPKSFKNAVEMARILAGSNEVQRCVASWWYRYVLERQEMLQDKPNFDAAWDRFARAGFDVRELIAGLATSRSFLYRQPATGEALR